MALGDLLDQAQAEADTTGLLGVPGQAKERLEDTLAHRLWHARATVADAHQRAAGTGFGEHAHVAATISPCVFEQVAQRAAQQALVTDDAERRAARLGIDPRGFFGGQAEQIDTLGGSERLRAVETACEQHLLDQCIELGHVGVDLALELLALGRAGVFEHRHGHLHARQWRAQLVARVGQQGLVRTHQRFDLRGGHVEAGRHRRDLVTSRHIDAVVQVPGTE